MNRSFFLSPLFLALIGLVLIGCTPFFVTNNYILGVMTFIAINTILAVSLNLLMGYAGQVSLGHAAFFGIGAYTSAILTTQHHLSPWLAMLAGILLASLIATVIGLPCLRLRGHYLAMATLGFGWIVYLLLLHWDTLTQGTSGIDGIPKLAIGHLVIGNDTLRFYFCAVVAVLILLISVNIVNSRVGRALRSLHGSEVAAASLGVNISWMKLQVFVLSAAYAALAGSLYAHCVNFVSPSPFGFSFSVELVVMVVIGGMASIGGALVGAGTITLLVEWLRGLGEAIPIFKEFDVIAHGAILMIVLIFMPAGLFCGVRDAIVKQWRKRRTAATSTPLAKEVATR